MSLDINLYPLTSIMYYLFIFIMSTYIDGFTIKLKDFCSVMTQQIRGAQAARWHCRGINDTQCPLEFGGFLRCSSQGTYEKRRNWKKYGNMGLLATNMKKNDEIF